jgi:hypothetical protein
MAQENKSTEPLLCTFFDSRSFLIIRKRKHGLVLFHFDLRLVRLFLLLFGLQVSRDDVIKGMQQDLGRDDTRGIQRSIILIAFVLAHGIQIVDGISSDLFLSCACVYVISKNYMCVLRSWRDAGTWDSAAYLSEYRVLAIEPFTRSKSEEKLA